MPLFCSKLSEFPISLNMKAKFLQMNHKAPHNPDILTFSLHPSHTRTLTNTETCSNLTAFALFAISAWAPLPPDFSLEHPSFPACIYSNVTFSVRHFQAVIFTITLSTLKTSFPFPPLFFFNALLLHKQSIFYQEIEESWIIPRKSHFVTLGLLLPFHGNYTKLRGLTLSTFPWKSGTKSEQRAEIKDIDSLKWSIFSNT